MGIEHTTLHTNPDNTYYTTEQMDLSTPTQAILTTTVPGEEIETSSPLNTESSEFESNFPTEMVSSTLDAQYTSTHTAETTTTLEDILSTTFTMESTPPTVIYTTEWSGTTSVDSFTQSPLVPEPTTISIESTTVEGVFENASLSTMIAESTPLADIKTSTQFAAESTTISTDDDVSTSLQTDSTTQVNTENTETITTDGFTSTETESTTSITTAEPNADSQTEGSTVFEVESTTQSSTETTAPITTSIPDTNSESNETSVIEQSTTHETESTTDDTTIPTDGDIEKTTQTAISAMTTTENLTSTTEVESTTNVEIVETSTQFTFTTSTTISSETGSSTTPGGNLILRNVGNHWLVLCTKLIAPFCDNRTKHATAQVVASVFRYIF